MEILIVPTFWGCDEETIFYKVLFFFKDFIHLFKKDTERGRDIVKGRSREPKTGLEPRTPGSWLEPKTDIQPLSHPGALILTLL